MKIILVVLAALLALAFTLAANFATQRLPEWTKPIVERWAWPAVIFLAVLIVVVAVVQHASLGGRRRVGNRRRVLNEYLRNLRDRLKTLKFLGGGAGVTLRLDDIYVPLCVAVYIAPGFPRAGTGALALPDLLRRVVETEPRRQVAILGEPGSGKTVILGHIALHVAQQDPDYGPFARALASGRLRKRLVALHRRFRWNWLRRLSEARTQYPIPFHLTLSDLARSGLSIREFLLRQLDGDGAADNSLLLDEMLAGGRCLVLLDALDEVAEEARARVLGAVNEFSSGHKRCPIVITSRSAGFRGSLPDFEEFEVQELTPEQTEPFLKKWFHGREHKVPALLTCLERPGLRSFTRNPLLLALTAFLHDRNYVLPRQRAELYDLSVVALTEHLDEGKVVPVSHRYEPEQHQSALRRLAAHFFARPAAGRDFSKPELTAQLKQILPELGVPAAETPDFMAELVERSGLIRERADRNYEFWHETFQEFLTACDFHKRGDEDGLRSHIAERRWREVIKLYAGLLDNATKLVESLSGQDVLLAGDVLADAKAVDPATGNRLVAELKRLAKENAEQRQDAADVLAELAEWQGPEFLAEQAGNHADAELARAALLAIFRAGDVGRLGPLIPLTSETVEFLREGFAHCPDKIRERLVALLYHVGYPRVTVPEDPMVLVPAGEFEMSSDEPGSDERPRHQVHLDAYWIDKYPVTNRQYARFCAETGHPVPPDPGFDGMPDYFRNNLEHPVVNVSWDDAMAYCRWAGKRLPTEAEWERAARGTDGWKYPWGEKEPDGSQCNFADRNCDSDWKDESADDGYRFTSPVGAFPKGLSPAGCLDMAGNVREWCSDWYSERYYRTSDSRRNPQGPDHGSFRVLRGGSWYDDAGLLRCAYRGRIEPSSRDGDVGFRCSASSPK